MVESGIIDRLRETSTTLFASRQEALRREDSQRLRAEAAEDKAERFRVALATVVERVRNDPEVQGHELSDIAVGALADIKTESRK